MIGAVLAHRVGFDRVAERGSVGFDGRARQHDAAYRVAFQRIDGAGDGQIRLAGVGRADAEGHIMFEDVLQVLALVRRTSAQVAAARLQHRAVGR